MYRFEFEEACICPFIVNTTVEKTLYEERTCAIRTLLSFERNLSANPLVEIIASLRVVTRQCIHKIHNMHHTGLSWQY